MRNILLSFALILIISCKTEEKQTVELSCGQCQFGLTTQDGCDLAVRIDDNAYFVDGANIDDFGDAHDKDSGFCEVIRIANVSGRIVDDRFQIETLELKD